MGRYLGQHFLVDEGILREIVTTIQSSLEETASTILWEIGPGQGALTQHIAGLVQEFYCFEKDERMKKYLEKILQPEQIVWGDVLETATTGLTDKVDPTKMSATLIVGNLPYYITSPILRSFFAPDGAAATEYGQHYPAGGVFLIQKEVADKIQTPAKKKSYLWRLLNYRYNIDYVCTIPPDSFDPPPKVDSAVIRLQTKNVSQATPYMPNYEQMLIFLDLVAPYTRKTLGKIQKMLAKKDITISLPAELTGARLEELGWEEMGAIVEEEV